MQVAVLGLGRMGMQIAKRLQKNNFDVLAWNRSEAPRQEFASFGGKVFEHREDLVKDMEGENRVFWVMLPQDIIEELHLHPLTCLVTLNNTNKKDLLNQGMVLCMDIYNNQSILNKINIPNDQINNVINEIKEVCGL
jgi:6-phosphogluconate dehydrogenase (decarboxylating)